LCCSRPRSLSLGTCALCVCRTISLLSLSLTHTHAHTSSLSHVLQPLVLRLLGELPGLLLGQPRGLPRRLDPRLLLRRSQAQPTGDRESVARHETKKCRKKRGGEKKKKKRQDFNFVKILIVFQMSGGRGSAGAESRIGRMKRVPRFPTDAFRVHGQNLRTRRWGREQQARIKKSCGHATAAPSHARVAVPTCPRSHDIGQSSVTFESRTRHGQEAKGKRQETKDNRQRGKGAKDNRRKGKRQKDSYIAAEDRSHERSGKSMKAAATATATTGNQQRNTNPTLPVSETSTPLKEQQTGWGRPRLSPHNTQ